MRRHSLIGALALTTLGMTAACDTVEPGDYVVYRVASTSSELSEGCYWEYQGADANVRNDENSLHSSGTFVLYAGQETTRYLDIGETTLDGEFLGDLTDGEGYEFEGKVIDVNWDDPSGAGSGAKRTTTIKTSVDLTVDGALAFGEVKIKTTWSCNGEACGEIPPSCTETIEFVGTEVEDVTLHHDVPPGLGAVHGNGSGTTSDDDGSGGAGAGGAGGAGGNGGAGGSTACNTCNDLLASTDGTVTEDDLCESSALIFTAMMDCACTTSCGSVCADNMCVDMSTTTAECSSCFTEGCDFEWNECLNDVSDTSGE